VRPRRRSPRGPGRRSRARRNRNFGANDLAKLHYGDGDYAVLRPGRYVVCAVSGQKIPLEQLRYWSAELQEAYASPGEALKRWQETHAA
jgi:hypothetical protein